MAEFDKLIGCAFRTGPAREANVLIHEVREAMLAAVGRAVNIEVVLTGRPWSYLVEIVGPRLALYLRSKKLRVLDPRGAFLSLFLDDTLYFVAAEDFYRVLRIAEGWSEERFAGLAASWEQTGRLSIAALPAAGSGEKPS